MNNTCEKYQGDLMALLEDALDAQSAARLREHLALCAACRSEYEALKGLGEELEAMGDALVKDAPAVDFVESVLDGIAEAEQAASRVVPLEERRRRVGMGWPALWPRWAAAAAIVLVVGLVGYRLLGEFRTSEVPVEISSIKKTPPSVQPGGAIPAPVRPVGPLAPRDAVEEKNRALKEVISGLKRPKPASLHATQLASLDTVRPEDVIHALKANLTDEKGVSWLKRWSTLTPEQAEKILGNPEVPEQAIVIASASLKPEEAQQALLKVVGQMPEDPYARLELTKAYAEEQGDPQAAAAAASQLDALRQLDPGNGVVYGLEALILLEQGDMEGALNALALLQQSDHASAYSLQDALAREQALVASGLDPDVARMLSAFTAGSTESDFLRKLGNQLLDYGRSFEQAGELETARRIGEGVSALAQQVTQSAQFSDVQLVGTEMQENAVTMLMNVYTALGSVGGLDALTQTAQNLSATIQQLFQFMSELGALFQSQIDPDWFRRAADLILQGGNLDIFQLL